ncbi:MAG: SulP family inorganic anion transporter [Verrucomicrobia bacterium]|nr:SulP family inorganic anion transporter [Verrucomicrobiota bacterium]MCH8525675.1 SulP family inorganic anion transporter [Kiritimatiellia bacterium]
MSARFSLRHWRADLLGGLTTAIVSLPLSLAFGVASGAGAEAGLYGAFFVGLFSLLFGSATRLVSEPTGPMTVFMAALIPSLIARDPENGLAIAFSVVMVAGLFQMALGALKLGQFVTLMPYGVVSGFMSGIGILLMIMQLPAIFGGEMPQGGVLGIFRALPDLARTVQVWEPVLAGISLVILIGFPARWRRVCPPQLLVIVGTALIVLLLPDREALRLVGEISVGIPRIRIPRFPPDLVTQILLDGMMLGMLGSIDALLTAMISDGLTREYHDSNRELVGQGLGNFLSGLFGGLPGAGATLRTVLNIQVGSKTATSGLFRVGFLVIFLFAFSSLLRPVPMAALAAISLKIGYDILDWSFMKRVHRVSASSTFMMYTVLLLTVFVDLVVAVGVGVFFANLLTIKRMSDLHAESVQTISVPRNDHLLSAENKGLLSGCKGQVLLFQMSGPMIFGVAKAIAREHAAMKMAKVLVLDLSEVPILGVTVCMSIENMVLDAKTQGVDVIVTGAAGRTRERLEKFGFFAHDHLFEESDLTAALRSAAARVEAKTS